MAASKKVRKSEGPKKEGNPDDFLIKHPSWNFSRCDIDTNCKWSFNHARLNEEFWTQIFPKLRQFESMTWNEIQTQNSKHNHKNSIEIMNKCAVERLAELELEIDSLFSLRLTGKIRIYGYRENSAFFLVWYDNDHGDNDTCVVRAKLKHT